MFWITRLAKCDITESLLVMLITLTYFCLIRLSFGVKNVCFKCNYTGAEDVGSNRVLSGVPSLNLQHGQEIALCQNETGHASVFFSDRWWFDLDPGHRVECDDEYYLCYSAKLVCETKQWESEAIKEEVSLLNGLYSIYSLLIWSRRLETLPRLEWRARRPSTCEAALKSQSLVCHPKICKHFNWMWKDLTQTAQSRQITSLNIRTFLSLIKGIRKLKSKT